MNSRLAELDALMAAPDYQPTLARPSVIARVLGVSRKTVSSWADRCDRTGVRRYPGSQYDVNACVRWMLIRDGSQAQRRASC